MDAGSLLQYNIVLLLLLLTVELCSVGAVVTSGQKKRTIDWVDEQK